jgi:uncharacterized Ntn-hydrolase superfamily protein
MTYSLLVRCPRSGRFGIAMASYAFAIGRLTDGIRANVGVTVSQGYPNPANNFVAMNLLGAGFTASHALGDLVANDPHSDWRQIVVVDRSGAVAVKDGGKLRPWSGHAIGESCVAVGDMLVGEAVLTAMLKGYAAKPDAVLEDRLLLALEAGRDAGGEKGKSGPLRERSAAVVVCANDDFTEWDLRVDEHDGAVAELRRIHAEYQPHAAYYIERAANPHRAVPAMEFADMLKKKSA